MLQRESKQTFRNLKTFFSKIMSFMR